MKARVENERGSGSEWLEVRLSPGEVPDLDLLSWLQSRSHRYLLEVEAGDRGRSEIRYNVTGLESLRSFLRSYEITSLQYENVLVSVAEAAGMLRREGRDPLCLQLDERYMYADMDGNLWFVLLPVEVDERRRARDPLKSFLERLARSRRISYSSADDLARSERLRKVVRADGFSSDDYEAFLVREYGIRLDFSDTAAPAAPPVARGRHFGPTADDDAITSVDLGGSGLRQAPAGAWAHGGRTTAFRLVLLDGSGTSYALGDCRAVLVGRGSACDVRILGNPGISRIHARVERDGDGFRVTDLGSVNGTIVRGLELRDGESERVGLGEAFELADLPVAIETA